MILSLPPEPISIALSISPSLSRPLPGARRPQQHCQSRAAAPERPQSLHLPPRAAGRLPCTRYTPPSSSTPHTQRTIPPLLSLSSLFSLSLVPHLSVTSPPSLPLFFFLPSPLACACCSAHLHTTPSLPRFSLSLLFFLLRNPYLPAPHSFLSLSRHQKALSMIPSLPPEPISIALSISPSLSRPLPGARRPQHHCQARAAAPDARRAFIFLLAPPDASPCTRYTPPSSCTPHTPRTIPPLPRSPSLCFLSVCSPPSLPLFFFLPCLPSPALAAAPPCTPLPLPLGSLSLSPALLIFLPCSSPSPLLPPLFRPAPTCTPLPLSLASLFGFGHFELSCGFEHFGFPHPKARHGGTAGNKFRMSLGLPVAATINCADNTGAKNLYIISVKGINYQGRLNRLPSACVGDMVMATVRKGKPDLRKKMMPAVIVCQR
ncbi:60S ribosomal protein L23 [Cinnamomum micranthum f. kanehirae]|uniref:60S ribosomal protein L23 n=1 Tax=Cinnamomum micranthum f. kanehirae TaxID=337451 RepID=A0A443PDE9_9MAGN|nr:60S ribosomal protein L23 [Cinnamomum micranthum f. kanehirae]